jgi:hypothetical protein
MTCAHFLEIVRQDPAFCEEFTRPQVIGMRFDETGNFHLVVCHAFMSPAGQERMRGTRLEHIVDVMSVWMRGEIVAKGPKRFRPSLEQSTAISATPRLKSAWSWPASCALP